MLTSRRSFVFLPVAFHLLFWLSSPIQHLDARSLKSPNQDLSRGNKAKAPSFESADGLERVTRRIRRGDTLAKLMRPFGLSGEERQFWFRSIRKHYSPKRLRAGREIYFYFTTTLPIRPEEKANRHLKALEIELDDDWILTWKREDQAIVFRKRQRPYDTEVKTASGTITDSLYENGVRLGLPPVVISQFVDIFGWDVNFHTDLRDGDSFKVLYERKHRKGKKKEIFRILAARLTNRGQEHFAFYFQKENGKSDYYDLEGRSLARAFLRYPVEFSRISSSFSHGRFHPILRVKRPHRGVDFVAKPGTPVRAVGDGRVTYAGWKKGGYGRFIQIQHGSIFMSRYAHLRRLARGIRRGVKVKKGQIIGYVGCSGSCTGSHLHFELYKNQKYVNPLRIKLPPGDRIGPALRRIFENAKRLFLAELDGSRPS